MNRFVWTVLAASLTISIACKRQSSDGAGSGAAPPAAAGAAATGSGAAGGSAATGAVGSDGSAAGGSAAAGAPAATGAAAGGSDTGSTATAAAGSAAAGGSAAAEGMAHRAGMCPSTVLGAKTTEAVKGKAVVVTIESADKDAITAIQKRTDKLLAEKKAGPATGVVHDQKGTYGGGKGLCPVHVPEGARVTAKHEAKGVVVTITPKDKPDELAKEIEGRIARASEWVKANVKEGDKGNQGGVGGGSGEDGSNHSGKGDGKGHERKKGNGGGTGGGGGKGTGGGGGAGDKRG